MIYAVDIDGTLCITQGSDYIGSTPRREVIQKVNLVYSQGHTILVFTARGSSSGIDWRELTEQQLSTWGVKYHQLLFGKPSYDKIVDDKAECPTAFLAGGCPLLADTSR